MIAALLPMKRIARFGLHRMGGLRPLIWSSRKQFRILTYHRFRSPDQPRAIETLDRQCAFLRRSFHPVSMSEIAQSLNTGAPLPPGALAVTVDDGYRDFLADAFPVFEKWRIPVTVYLTTDFIDRKLWSWWDRVEYAALHGRAHRVRYSLPPERDARELPLETGAQRQSAAAAICEDLKLIPNRARIEFLDRLADLFDAEIPREAPAEYAALTWDEVRWLAGAGVEFGAHSKSHPILPSLEDEASLEEEIAGSKVRVEHELGRPAIHFCYPNGDYDDAVVDAVARGGFQTAVVVDAGLNTPPANRYLLKRLSMALYYSDDYFRELVAGMHV
jgi:peptidoglycan/xylan/chitin deacetylase (PgdA/CDA1 family)